LEREIHQVYNKEVEKKKYLAKHVVEEVKRLVLIYSAQIPNTCECESRGRKKSSQRIWSGNHAFGIGMRVGVKRVIKLCEQAGDKYKSNKFSYIN